MPDTSHGSLVPWHWLGIVPYGHMLRRFAAMQAHVTAHPGRGALWLASHPTVITLGRSANRAHVLASPATLAERGIDVVTIERGGDVTLHGPGQLMIYPVVKIRSVVQLLDALGTAIVEGLSDVGVPGARWQRAPAGVWLGDAKVAACGIHVARGVVTHGFALNVATPPEDWQFIQPCGLATPVISLRDAGAPWSAAGSPGAAVVGERVGNRSGALRREPLSAGLAGASAEMLASVALQLAPRLSRALSDVVVTS